MAICGDGGFMMNSQDLETAIRLGLNLVVLIIEDRGYGMVRWKQKSMGFRDFALSFENSDFVSTAEAYEAKGERVGATDDLVPVLDAAAFKAGGVHLVVAPINYSKDKRVLFDELRAKVAKIA